MDGKLIYLVFFVLVPAYFVSQVSAAPMGTDGYADRVIIRDDGSGNAIWYADASGPDGFGDGIAEVSGGFGLMTDTHFLGDVSGDGIADRVIARQDIGGGYWAWFADYSTSTGFGDGIADAVQGFGGLSLIPHAVVDLDGDGIADRVGVDDSTGSHIYYGDKAPAGGGFGDSMANWTMGFGAASMQLIGLADLNGDGLADRVINLDSTGGLNWISDMAPVGGGFGDGSIDWSGYFGAVGMGLFLGDLNADSYSDRAVAIFDGANYNWLGDLSSSTNFGDGSADINQTAPFGVQNDILLLGDVLLDCEPPVGDLNEDCIVNFLDFTIFVSHWLDNYEHYVSTRVYADTLWGIISPIPDDFGNTTPANPKWINNLILYQMRIDTFAPNYRAYLAGQATESPIVSATTKLDYLADLGINGIVLNPVAKSQKVYDPPNTHIPIPKSLWNYYAVIEPDQLDDDLGTNNEFKTFINSAHDRDIRVFVDVVPHGVDWTSSLLTNHPDWFQKDQYGQIIGTWGMADFDWTVQAMRNWWIDTMAYWINEYDLDGFRCDCEPYVAGYDLWEEVRQECQANGKAVMIMSEARNDRQMAYHTSQHCYGTYSPWGREYDTMDLANIVDIIKSENETYYTFGLSSHDYGAYQAKKRPVYFGYTMLFTPFLPFWRSGEEFNASVVFPTTDTSWCAIYEGQQGTPQVYEITESGAGSEHGQDFISGSSGIEFDKLRLHVWAAENSPQNSLRLTLYYSSPDYIYSNTINTEPIGQITFTGFGMDDYLTWEFSETVYNGHMLLVIDNAINNVGIWGSNGSTYGGTAFVDGVATTDYDLQVEIERAGYGQVLYFNPLFWEDLNDIQNNDFFETVKDMICIRGDYGYIIYPFVAKMKDRQVVKVDSTGTDIQAFAMYRGDSAIVVIGKKDHLSGNVNISVPLASMGIDSFSQYRVVDLLSETEEIVAKEALSDKTVYVENAGVKALLIEGIGIWKKLYKRAPDNYCVLSEDNVGQGFNAETAFSKLRIKAWEGLSDGNIKLYLYHADTNYSIELPAVAVAEFSTYDNCHWLEMSFEYQLPPGNYRWKAECTTGDAGIYVAEGSTHPNPSFINETEINEFDFVAEICEP